jgi:hypothetical protein
MTTVIAVRLIKLLIFLALAFGIAAIAAYSTSTITTGTFSSIYLHATVGIGAGIIGLVNVYAFFGVAYLLWAYQDLQSGDLTNFSVDENNASDVGGYIIGIMTVLLLRALFDYLLAPRALARKQDELDK